MQLKNLKADSEKNVVENVLSNHAAMHTPKGTEVPAVVDQWLHAIATGSELF